MTEQPTMQGITERATRDASFRRDLIADPHGVLSREYGLTLPQSLEMVVLEETSSKAYMVLPLPSPEAGDELNDDALEAVAGGTNGPVLDSVSVCWTGNYPDPQTCRLY